MTNLRNDVIIYARGDQYLNALKEVINIPDIKVITGVRRSGKSKLLDAWYNYLIKSIDDANVVRIKLNLKKFEKLKNTEKLYSFIKENYKEECNNFLLIDEIQMCDRFETISNSILHT